MSTRSKVERLQRLHQELDLCTRCPNMDHFVVHGPPIASRILLIGQAPGSREGVFKKPFAWTAGKTLFSWFHKAVGASEDEVRAKIYIAAVARCFPGKAPGGRGDREPDAAEIAACRTFLEREVEILQPELVIPIGKLAITNVLGRPVKQLSDVVGKVFQETYLGVRVDVVPLPHPSGASTWPHVEPGRTLLADALGIIGSHPSILATFGAAQKTDS